MPFHLGGCRSILRQARLPTRPFCVTLDQKRLIAASLHPPFRFVIEQEINMKIVATVPQGEDKRAEFLGRLLEADHASELAELINGIAHELNQPLAAMTTFSQAGARMLGRASQMMGPSLDVFHEISETALKAGARLQAIRKLFEPGSRHLDRCRISDLIKEVQPVLEALAHAVDAHLTVQIPDDLPEMLIERLKIQQVLLALTRNASFANSSVDSDRSIRIDVLVHRYSVETGGTDQGTGVPVADQNRIFQPFFTTKRSAHGLGLSSSQAIIESHGGTIGFDNLASGGVRFWFRLPVAADRAGAT
jgi:two-component system sensor kinase FixL